MTYDPYMGAEDVDDNRALNDAELDALDICRYCYHKYDRCTCPEANENA